MRRHNCTGVWIVLAVTALMCWENRASAYVGPGAGVEFIGFFMTLVWWAGAALVATLLWPFYAIVRRFRGRRPEPAMQLVATLGDNLKARQQGP